MKSICSVLKPIFFGDFEEQLKQIGLTKIDYCQSSSSLTRIIFMYVVEILYILRFVLLTFVSKSHSFSFWLTDTTHVYGSLRKFLLFSFDTFSLVTLLLQVFSDLTSVDRSSTYWVKPFYLNKYDNEEFFSEYEMKKLKKAYGVMKFLVKYFPFLNMISIFFIYMNVLLKDLQNFHIHILGIIIGIFGSFLCFQKLYNSQFVFAYIAYYLKLSLVNLDRKLINIISLNYDHQYLNKKDCKKLEQCRHKYLKICKQIVVLNKFWKNYNGVLTCVYSVLILVFMYPVFLYDLHWLPRLMLFVNLIETSLFTANIFLSSIQTDKYVSIFRVLFMQTI